MSAVVAVCVARERFKREIRGGATMRNIAVARKRRTQISGKRDRIQIFNDPTDRVRSMDRSGV